MEFIFFCKPKKLKTHEPNFYEAVKLSKSLKTASKDPVLVPGKCSSFWTESGKGIIPKHCIMSDAKNDMQEREENMKAMPKLEELIEYKKARDHGRNENCFDGTHFMSQIEVRWIVPQIVSTIIFSKLKKAQKAWI